MTFINKIFIHVAVIVFLSLARVRFPKIKSVAEVIRSRYRESTIKKIWKLEKLDRHQSQFLRKFDNNVIPKFFNFHLANCQLKYLSATFVNEFCSEKKIYQKNPMQESYSKNLLPQSVFTK